jgi:hypothetical protein
MRKISKFTPYFCMHVKQTHFLQEKLWKSGFKVLIKLKIKDRLCLKKINYSKSWEILWWFQARIHGGGGNEGKSVITTRSSVIYTRKVKFLHAECYFNTHECDFNTHKIDFYTQSNISICTVWFYTLSTHMRVSLTHMRVNVTLTSVISTRTSDSYTQS